MYAVQVSASWFKVCREFKIEKNGDHRKLSQTKTVLKLSLSNAPCVYLYLPTRTVTAYRWLRYSTAQPRIVVFLRLGTSWRRPACTIRMCAEVAMFC